MELLLLNAGHVNAARAVLVWICWFLLLLVWFGSVQLIFMVMVMMCDALLGSSNLLSLVFTNNKHSSMACWRSDDPHIQLNICRPSLCLFLIALPSLQLQKLK